MLGLGARWAADTYPTAAPELSTHVGWLLFALLGLLLAWALCHADAVRRGLLGREDPRVYAVLRIGVGLMTIQCFWNLEPYWRMLWSDEGMFLADEARSRFGQSELAGWTELDGFLDGWAVAKFMAGDHSLLILHGSPAFVRGYMWTFFALLAAWIVGFRTRITGLACWVLMLGVYNRNSVYIEGTDTVYKVVWFLLVLAPVGHAWSVDNALRTWRERRRRNRGATGLDRVLLADRALAWAWAGALAGGFLTALGRPVAPVAWVVAGGAVLTLAQGWVEALGEEGPPPEPVVYRHVSSWPRILLMVQVAAIYTTTGLVKTGSVWARGDALYYALNMDHFYRFEGWTQQVSAPLSLNLFRLATWVTHWWEICFPVVLLGMILRFFLREQAALRTARWRIWLGRAALVGAWAVLYRVVILAAPYLLAEVERAPADPTLVLQVAHGVLGGAVPVAVAAWFLVGWRPIRLLAPGRRLGRVRLPALRIDQHFLRAWFTGRRIWLTLGLSFHGFLILFMNIGMFPFIMLMTYVAYTDSGPWARLGRWVLARPRLGRRIPASAAASFAPPDAGKRGHDGPVWWLDPYRVVVGGATLVAVLARRRPPSALAAVRARARGRDPVVPDAIVLLAAAGIVGLLAARGRGVELMGLEAAGWMARALQGAGLAVVAVAALVALFRRAGSRAEGEPSRLAGAVPRTIALGFCAWHVGALATELSPSYPIFSPWRGAARRPFTSYVNVAALTQSWRMFAPNPPRSNTFMQTIVVEGDGDRWDLRNNAFDWRPFPWIVNDRMRKMQRRMVGNGKWYLRYWSSWQCREWTLRTGEVPERIEVWRLSTAIPRPDVVWHQGPFHPRELEVARKHVQSDDCERIGRLPTYVKLRHGLPLDDEDRSEAEKDAERSLKRAESRRRLWAQRRDFGGPDPEPP
jgi:hypothetical protein